MFIKLIAQGSCSGTSMQSCNVCVAYLCLLTMICVLLWQKIFMLPAFVLLFGFGCVTHLYVLNIMQQAVTLNLFQGLLVCMEIFCQEMLIRRGGQHDGYCTYCFAGNFVLLTPFAEGVLSSIPDPLRNIWNNGFIFLLAAVFLLLFWNKKSFIELLSNQFQNIIKNQCTKIALMQNKIGT